MFICPKCGIAFDKKYNLDRHINKQKSCDLIKSKKIYSCKYCPKIFTKQIYLESHTEKYHLEYISKLNDLKVKPESENLDLQLDVFLKKIINEKNINNIVNNAVNKAVDNAVNAVNKAVDKAIEKAVEKVLSKM